MPSGRSTCLQTSGEQVPNPPFLLLNEEIIDSPTGQLATFCIRRSHGCTDLVKLYPLAGYSSNEPEISVLGDWLRNLMRGSCRDLFFERGSHQLPDRLLVVNVVGISQEGQRI